LGAKHPSCNLVPGVADDAQRAAAEVAEAAHRALCAEVETLQQALRQLRAEERDATLQLAQVKAETSRLAALVAQCPQACPTEAVAQVETLQQTLQLRGEERSVRSHVTQLEATPATHEEAVWRQSGGGSLDGGRSDQGACRSTLAHIRLHRKQCSWVVSDAAFLSFG
jgi:multidrug resistance efflux pump